MSDIKIIAADQFDTLVDRFVSLEWPVTTAGADALLDQWGWVVEERVDDRSMVVDPGFGFDALDAGWFHLDDADGAELSDIVVAISDRVDDGSAAVARDAFAAQVASMTSKLGPPAERRGGTTLQAVWLLPSDSRLVLYGATTGSGLLSVTSPAYGRLLRDTD